MWRGAGQSFACSSCAAPTTSLELEPPIEARAIDAPTPYHLFEGRADRAGSMPSRRGASSFSARRPAQTSRFAGAVRRTSKDALIALLHAVEGELLGSAGGPGLPSDRVRAVPHREPATSDSAVHRRPGRLRGRHLAGFPAACLVCVSPRFRRSRDSPDR
jgi:hypothetical protein